MRYKEFDALGNKKSRNMIIQLLMVQACTYDELSEKVGLNRTTIFYHVKEMIKEGIAIQKMVGKVAYIGLIPDQRKRDNKEERG